MLVVRFDIAGYRFKRRKMRAGNLLGWNRSELSFLAGWLGKAGRGQMKEKAYLVLGLGVICGNHLLGYVHANTLRHIRRKGL